ncbi:MAG: FG-GAP-like repeat-containing protein [Planctomycetota bacterium]|nr:FG-GAP-like repeat-containing protein [Planctomycetota bacterium]
MRFVSASVVALTIASLAGGVASAQCGPFYAAPQSLLTTPNPPRDFLAADLNADGRTDLCVANSGASSGVTIYRANTGDNNFTISQTIATGSNSQIRVAARDFDGDAIVDLVIAESTSAVARFYKGLGNATYNVVAPPAVAIGASMNALSAADFNTDGKLDLVVGNGSAGSIGVLLGNGDGTFQARTTNALATTNVLAVSDLNADGRPDVVASLVGTAQVAVLLANANGTLQAPVTYAAAGGVSAATQFAFADLNVDGSPDLLAACGGSAVGYWQGRPNGTFEAAQTIYPGGPSGPEIFGLVAADLNADGKPDLGVTLFDPDNPNLLLPGVYLATGFKTFAPALTYGKTTSTVISSLLTTIDRNRDGLIDLIWVSGDAKMGVLESIAGGQVQITSRPANVVAAAGETATLTVGATGAGITYKWYKDGQPLLASARVTGTSSATLQITGLLTSDTAVYECRISNPCTSEARVAALVAVAQPANACSADFNGDGFITFEDFDAFVAAFEQGC